MQTITELVVLYDGGFERNGNEPNLRAGYKRIAFCRSGGHHWSKTTNNELVLIFKDTPRKLSCPACGRPLKIIEVPISEQGYENQINNRNQKL